MVWNLHLGCSSWRTSVKTCLLQETCHIYVFYFFSSSIQNWAEDLISGNTTTGRILVVFAFTCSMVSFVLYIISKSFSYLYKLRYLKREVGPDRCQYQGLKYVKNIFSHSLKNIQTETTQFVSVCIFFVASVFTFQFLNDKIHNYVKRYNCEFRGYTVTPNRVDQGTSREIL